MNNILVAASLWYLFEKPRRIFSIWETLLLFGLNYFSVPILIRTFFSPWRRYGLPYSRVFEFGKNFEAFVFNSMSRIIGAIMRTILIILGLLFETLIFFSGLIVLVSWYLLPFILIALVVFGLGLLLL